MKSFWNEIGNIRGIRWIGALALAGILLLGAGLWGNSHSAQTETEEAESVRIQFYTETLEKRISELCCEVQGIEEAHVLLTLDGGSEFVYAENESSSARDYVILQGTDEQSPVLVKEIYPQIRGVAVVCTRGNDSAVRLTVTELLAAALGIPSSSIRVAGT